MRVYHSQGKSFLILSDSLPSLRAISNMKYDRSILAKILELTEMGRRSFLSGFLHGHVGIRENSAADSAAKGALDVDVSDELSPFSDFGPLVSKYVRALATRVGRVSSQQPVYIGSFQSRMIVFLILVGEETVISPLHISHSNMTRTFFFFFLFSYGREGIYSVTSYHTTYFAFFVLILLKQENYISQLGHGRCYSRIYYLLAVTT